MPPSRVGDHIGLVTVNVGLPKVLWQRGDDVVVSGIAKSPVASGTVLALSDVNLDGDGQADPSVHGGTDKAVYAYPSEHLGPWVDELGGPLGDAPFGENLSTVGVTEADVRIGDRWAWGTALLEVCQPRWPCRKLALHRRQSDIQQRMKANGRTGWYLRVLRPGDVPVDGPITVEHVDPAGLTVADAHVAMSDRRLERRALVEALAAHERLADEWGDPLRDRLA